MLQCAGGLMIEHPALQPYVERVDGTLDSVMGLSTRLLASLAAEHRAGLARPDPAGVAHARAAVLSQRRWAVVGDVLNEAKAASALVARLRDAGREVALVNPRDSTGRCAKSVAEVAGRARAVCLVIAPARGAAEVEGMWRAGVRHLWVQPGADAPAVLRRAEALGLNVHTGCVLREDLPPPVEVDG